MNNTIEDADDEEIHKQVEQSIRNSPSRIPKRIRVILPDGTYAEDGEEPEAKECH